jgi:hypothetical protein
MGGPRAKGPGGIHGDFPCREQPIEAEQIRQGDGAQCGGGAGQEPASIERKAAGEGEMIGIRAHGFRE